jgi:hypothetical protein
MNSIKSLGLAGVAAAALFTGQALATPTCPAGTQGTHVCVAENGGDGPNSSLQDKVDGMTTQPGDINVYTQQHTPSAYWSVGATGLSENKFVFEIAGNANVNTFGIFDPADPGNRLQLFSGEATSGWSTQLAVTGDGTYIATFFDASHAYRGQATGHFSTGNLFGYYLGVPDQVTPGGAFFSDTSLNEAGGTTYPGGTPHMVAFAGDGSTSLTMGGFTGTFLPSEYLLAWEDLAWANSDLDYNDFVVLVESVQPVPEPAALGMFGLGMLLIGGFMALRRRPLKA